MKIGLLLPTREAVAAGRPDAAAMLELAERAEAAGFDSVWAGDSLLARPRFEPLTLLAGAAARTRRVELGTAVLVAPLRNPVVLAHAAATVDQIAQGRLILGVGFGARGEGTRREFAAAEADYERRAGRLGEQMELCRLLWRGEPVSYEGRYWRLENATLLPRPHRPGGPPLWVGGSGPTSVKLTARHADGFFPNSSEAERLRESWQGVQAEAKAAGRKPPLLALYTSVNVGPDAALAQRELEAFIERYYGAPYPVISKIQGCSAGTAQACAERLAPFLAVGVEHLILRLAGADQATQFQRVVEGLLPRLRELRP
jgi:probable F420-dependent oxidoreductase